MPSVYVIRFLLYSHLALFLSTGYGIEECPRSFNCGEFGSFNFPFTKAELPECGLITLQGCDDPKLPKMIEFGKNGRPLLVTDVLQQDRKISTFDQDLHERLNSKSCDVFNHNITIPSNSPLVSFDIRNNLTLFRCNRTLNVSPPRGLFHYSCHDYNIYYYNGTSYLKKEPVLRAFSACSILQLPSKDVVDTKYLTSILSGNMIIEVRLSDDCDKCYNHMGGQCQLDSNNNFFCYAEHKRKILNLALGLGLAIFLGVVMLLFLACCFTRKLYPYMCSFFWTKDKQSQQIMEVFLKQHGPLSTRRYSYFEIHKVTDNFKTKLGQGGYGSVYKGKLKDGRFVAVKVLGELKGSGEEFINEVASISRTSHVNIVGLVGFCFEGSKRALVYEFMPNGSLERFIYEDNADVVDPQLHSNTLFDIAIGVARGLEYLHRGCNIRILHFDIKPHNILLDEDFCPKISDFGLAKVCPRKNSIVSLLGARGTPEYIAPEVFSRSFGGVSHKSDVYSYGMMVLEMIGGRKNINVEVDCSSEIYFPHWIYKRLELNQELGLRCNIKSDIDIERIRKMTVVSLWCIQTDPLTRPTMSKVVEMLEGNLESLQVPPKPYLSSPSRSPVHCSTQTCETL